MQIELVNMPPRIWIDFAPVGENSSVAERCRCPSGNRARQGRSRPGPAGIAGRIADAGSLAN